SLSLLRDLLNEMLGRIVRNRVCRVESEAVDVKLFHPVERVLREMISDGRRLWSVQIERGAPWGRMRGIEIVIGINTHVVAIRPEMVVDDIEKDGQPRPVRGIDQTSQVVRRSVRS